MATQQHDALQCQMENLLDKGYIRVSMNSCVTHALLVPKIDGSSRMCVDSQTINKIINWYS